MLKEVKLKPRHYKLRRYILILSKLNKIAFPENIAATLSEYNVKDFRRKINNDVRMINFYGTFDKPIISFHDGGYKIPANMDEYLTFSKSKWNEISNMAKLQKHLDKKAKLDGQVKLDINPYGSAVYEPFIGGKSYEPDC